MLFVNLDTPVWAQTKVRANQITQTDTFTLTNLNSTVTCDGVKYATIQAAAAALPVSGGEVVVPSASTCTWNGVGMTGSVTVRFLSANATYAVSGPIVMTGGLNHLICQSGQPIGDSSLNGTTGGTTLTWGTGALTGSQDAVSASSNMTNDHNTVEGCKVRILNSVGRHCINFSGVTHGIIRNAVLDDCVSDGYHLETGPNHAYDNLVDHVDVIHVGGAGAHLLANAAANDIDRATFINFNYHPQDPVGNVGGSTGAGVLLEAPSGCTVNCRISNITFVGSLINGTANGTAGLELRVSQSGINAGTIQYISWTNGEIEDVFQTNTATGLLITDTSNLDVQNVQVIAPATAGFTTGTNISRSNATAYFYRPFPFGANRAGGSFLSDYVADIVGTGTAVMTTAQIAAVSGTTVTCGATVTVSATDTVSTDTITVAPNAVESNPNTGLILRYWPTANNVNFAWCNPTGSALTPVAETINWRVVR